jgi:hypothetical protein
MTSTTFALFSLSQLLAANPPAPLEGNQQPAREVGSVLATKSLWPRLNAGLVRETLWIDFKGASCVMRRTGSPPIALHCPNYPGRIASHEE